VSSKLLFFPVEPEPLAMKAGLIRFPQDFGHGELDGHVFLVDDDLPRALAEKRKVARARTFDAVRTEDERRAERAVYTFVRERLAKEAPERLADADDDRALAASSESIANATSDSTRDWNALGRALQEDLVVMHRGPSGDGRAIVAHVSFPSGWRPEHVAGASFRGIHEPVPGFPGKREDSTAREAASRSMMDAMVLRGPYVRFVWTVCADDELDHHPDAGLRKPKTSITHFRVERQLTWPFPEVEASLFVIRTFVYSMAELGEERVAILKQALASMPDEIRRYKGLEDEAIAAFVAS
jgi:hypothetical protein